MYGILKVFHTCTVKIYLQRPAFIERVIHTQVLNLNMLKRKPTKGSQVDELLEKYKEDLLYSDFIEKGKLKLGYKRNIAVRNMIAKKLNKQLIVEQSKEPLPLTLKYMDNTFETTNICNDENSNEIETKSEPQSIQFPFQENTEHVTAEKSSIEAPMNNEEINSDLDIKTGLELYNSSKEDHMNNEEINSDLEVKTRLELYNKSSDHLNWMEYYENYEHDETLEVPHEWKVNYGTPDPTMKISKVPCGGCGALLHCKDTVIPGYMPSELFKNSNQLGGVPLSDMVCQRCHFLKHYNLALQVRVSPDDYPEVLKTIGYRQKALVVLMVDLLDFPCSIWPGIADLIGSHRPIIVVGNKVDLLPQDGKGFLNRVTQNLENSVREWGFGMFNIKHVGLISAKTGYGIEDLITKMQNVWEYRGDVFLVGCTNVGKSSLFNALLQSDYCKSQAVDLIQRATTSPWPGTTLNLLKFPILRPTGWRLFVRTKRMISTKKLEQQERKLLKEQLRTTRNPKFATLIGHIDRSFSSEKPVEETNDVFAVSGKDVGASKQWPLDEDEDHRLSKWCYDTPGVVQPDQIIHLLTTEELVLTFPKMIIKPRTFSLEPGTSIFIAGLARMDYLEGCQTARFTVFCSNELPITICKSSKADEIYNQLLSTEVFAVPLNYPERLKLWPGLQSSRNFSVTGIDENASCADMVLSSAGWVAITPQCGASCTVQGWTPEMRGIYMRDCLLAKAVSLRGKKVRGSCAYKVNKLYLK